MDFMNKLERVLDLLEARKLVKQSQRSLVPRFNKETGETITPTVTKEKTIRAADDNRNKRVGHINLHGWQVLFYDHVHTDSREEEHEATKIRLPLISKRVNDFLVKIHNGDVDLERAKLEIAADLERNNTWAFKILNASTAVVGSMNDAEQDETNKACKAVYRDFCRMLMDHIGLTDRDRAVIRVVDMFQPPPPAVDETAIFNLAEAIKYVLDSLPKLLSTYVQKLTTKVQTPPAKFIMNTPAIKQVLGAVADVLVRIKALGVRRSAHVPIQVHLHEQHPYSGFGNTRKAGDETAGSRPRTQGHERHIQNQQDTHRVNVYVTNTDSDDEIKEVTAHEIGHVLFAINPDVQEMLAYLAHGRSGEASDLGKKMMGQSDSVVHGLKNKAGQFTAPSAYGSKDYVYSGLNTPIMHHTSGNEWMAEMFTAIVLGKPLESFDKMQVRLFKLALATINGHPHAGRVYQRGQAAAGRKPYDGTLTHGEPVEQEDDGPDLGTKDYKSQRRYHKRVQRDAKRRFQQSKRDSEAMTSQDAD